MRLTPQCIKKDMDGLISKLIEQGVCDDSNFSAIRCSGSKTEISFSGAQHLSIALRDIEYTKIYSALADKRSYNMRLIDGALLQMMYRLENDSLLQHRLGFTLRHICGPSKMTLTHTFAMRCLWRLWNVELFHSHYVLILMRAKVFTLMGRIPKVI